MSTNTERDTERITYDLTEVQAQGLKDLAILKDIPASAVVRELLHKAFKDNNIPMPTRDLELLEMIRITKIRKSYSEQAINRGGK